MAVYRNDGRWEPSNALLVDARVTSYDKRLPAPGAQHASIHAGAGFSRADFRWYLLT
jgi:hypothetical protein